ncbi:MAG TPA: TVP38/TMEM64 family protein [Vicinamibacterales bacterium]|nr:TVP38/TMEM64 family protein [Vicinamibacterales bacterium]
MTTATQTPPTPAPPAGRRTWPKLVAAALVVVAGVLVARQFGVFQLLSLDNVDRLDAWFRGFGIWAPAIFIGVWIAASVFFLPGLPVTIVGALIFGPIYGTVFSSIGATIGATAAFLVGRYAARGMVEGLLSRNERLRAIDDGVRTQGWRMLMITRLVPVFPFNAQNYVYGLTQISLPTYVIVTFLCMLPGCIAFNFAAGSIRAGQFGRFFLYLAVAGVLFVVLSLIPGWLKKRYQAVP